MVAIRRRLGDRLAYLGGLPTAEVYAAAYKAIGVPVVLVGGLQLHPEDRDAVLRRAVASDDRATDRPAARRVLPALPGDPQPARGLRGQHRQGGARLVGRDAGPVRPPLTDLFPAEAEELDALIRALGPQ